MVLHKAKHPEGSARHGLTKKIRPGDGGGRGPDNVLFVFGFKSSTYSTEGRTNLPEKQFGPKGYTCLSRGSIPVFPKKPLATCDFPGGGLNHLALFGSANGRGVRVVA